MLRMFECLTETTEKLMNIFSKGIWPRSALLLCLAVTATTGCRDRSADYQQTVGSGFNMLPWPREMEALYGEADHAITHYAFAPGPRDWWTEVYFGGRYRLTMHVDVEIDYDKHFVLKAVSAPRFFLAEVKSLERLESGQIAAQYSHQWLFDEAKWRKLVESHGDWSVIALPVRKDDPVPGFDDYVKAWRRGRVPIKR